MKVIIINDTPHSDPAPSLIKSLEEIPGKATIYVSHKRPDKKHMWVKIDANYDLHIYANTHNMFLKTSRISHERRLYRSRLSLDEMKDSAPILTCTYKQPLEFSGKVCYSCEWYDAESKTCERYPVPINMEHITKRRCGEFKSGDAKTLPLKPLVEK